ncbi:MAG: class I SAM-dependent methyltransferase [Limisphaerales bacterium]
MRELLQEIYATRTVVGRSGAIHKLDSEISPEEGSLLSSLIASDPSVVRTLEVGCAYGMSSLHICSAINGRNGAHHTIIDPFQNERWDGTGIANLERGGMRFFQLIEEKSEFALPRLCLEAEEQFDLIFVDGFHTFDHTLIDCFYATRLLRTGGYLVVDDASWRSVNRCISYLAKYPCYRIHGAVSVPKPATPLRRAAKIFRKAMPKSVFGKLLHPNLIERIWTDSTNSMVALKKVCKDERDWKWYADF